MTPTHGWQCGSQLQCTAHGVGEDDSVD